MRGGIAWRLLPSDFPPWRMVYRWFATWRYEGLFERINHALVMADRERTGRAPHPAIGDNIAKKGFASETISYCNRIWVQLMHPFRHRRGDAARTKGCARVR